MVDLAIRDHFSEVTTFGRDLKQRSEACKSKVGVFRVEGLAQLSSKEDQQGWELNGKLAQLSSKEGQQDGEEWEVGRGVGQVWMGVVLCPLEKQLYVS